MKKALFSTFLFALSLPAADYFPMQSGNQWTYAMGKSDASFTVRVGAPVTVNDLTYFPLSGYVDRTVLVRYDSNRLLYLDEESGGEGLLTSLLPGDLWKAPARACNLTGAAARTASNVVEVHYSPGSCADTGLESEVFVEGVGMTRRSVQSFVGPRPYELVAARVGGVAVESGFTVSVDDAFHVTMRLQVVAPVTLPFTSSQEYEIVMRDDLGRGVYTWSADKSFLQALHDLEVAREWTVTVAVPKPAPGSYTVQVWMTTSGGAPRYAATAPVVVK